MRPSPLPPISPEPLDEIDAAWEQVRTDARVSPRNPLPTLMDADPLRFDIGYDRKRDPTRDSQPTLPDLDPLRHDKHEDA